MKKKGPIYYDCWFSHSRDYFKCLHGLQGAKVVTAKKDERGIIEVGNYLPFSQTKAMDKTTEEKLLELPHPFFVSQILEGKSKKVYQFTTQTPFLLKSLYFLSQKRSNNKPLRIESPRPCYVGHLSNKMIAQMSIFRLH